MCWVFWDAMIFCNNFARWSQNKQSATHARFWKTCLFTNYPNISTTIRGSQFQGIREKAGLSKTGVTSTELPTAEAHWCYFSVISTINSCEGRYLCVIYFFHYISKSDFSEGWKCDLFATVPMWQTKLRNSRNLRRKYLPASPLDTLQSKTEQCGEQKKSHFQPSERSYFEM